MSDRIEVRKTCKLYVNGAFIRSESGRTYEVVDSKGEFFANVAKASRKDVRDAVVAARAAQSGWAKATAYNRGQVVYRIAEVLESRRAQLESELAETSGLSSKKSKQEVDIAIDRLVWYAGWSDKLSAVVGSNNAVAGPFFNFTIPEPMGVVAAFAPETSPLVGLVSVIAPIIVSGNSTVVVASYSQPVPAVTLTEVLATSDVPNGVVNLLTGERSELGSWLAEHMDVDGLDLTGVDNAELATELERSGTVNVKRVLRPSAPDWNQPVSTARLRTWLEAKTVWHPIGS